ncbi:aminoacyl-tRNA hydrolase [Aquibaculum sediminis]|uniref:aminoacyl-tRNA hydrolase n=1 Tax=Aquibaculum sediminis TaxID=3231907 RepID=UPI0034513CE1
MLLLVGLGNPGPKYAGNRHNVGFMAVEAMARRRAFSPWRQRFQSDAAEGQFGADKVLVLKPMTYMNESGRAVGEALRFFKLGPEDVLVLHDELDLAPGKIKLKRGGGHAGHNGLRSIAQHIGPEFRRLRIGIGHPGDKERVLGHVLGDLSKGEQPLFEQLFDAMARHAALLGENSEQADNAYTSKVMQDLAPPKPKASAPNEGPAKAPSADAPPEPTPAPREEQGALARALKGALHRLSGDKQRDE